MNCRVLVCLIAIILVAVVGCRPRHPPHIPQPFSAEPHRLKSTTPLESSTAGLSDPLFHPHGLGTPPTGSILKVR